MTAEEALKVLDRCQCECTGRECDKCEEAYEAIQKIVEKVEVYKSIANDVINDVRNEAYLLRPDESSYFNQGVAECMVLDCKKEIAAELEEIYEEYYKKICEVEE